MFWLRKEHCWKHYTYVEVTFVKYYLTINIPLPPKKWDLFRESPLIYPPGPQSSGIIGVYVYHMSNVHNDCPGHLWWRTWWLQGTCLVSRSWRQTPVTWPACSVFPPQRGTLNHCHYYHPLVTVHVKPFGGLNRGLNLLLLVYFLATLVTTWRLSSTSSFTLSLSPSKLVISIAGLSDVELISGDFVVVPSGAWLDFVEAVAALDFEVDGDEDEALGSVDDAAGDVDVAWELNFVADVVVDVDEMVVVTAVVFVVGLFDTVDWNTIHYLVLKVEDAVLIPFLLNRCQN